MTVNTLDQVLRGQSQPLISRTNYTMHLSREIRFVEVVISRRGEVIVVVRPAEKCVRREWSFGDSDLAMRCALCAPTEGTLSNSIMMHSGRKLFLAKSEVLHG